MRIKLLNTTQWWDAGERPVIENEDEGNIYFTSASDKYCAVRKADAGIEFEYVPETEDQKYYAENRNEILAQKRNYRKGVKEAVILQLGGRCRRCGYHKSTEALDIRGGIPRGAKGYTAYYNAVLKVIQMVPEHDYYLLCANCQREIE